MTRSASPESGGDLVERARARASTMRSTHAESDECLAVYRAALRNAAHRGGVAWNRCPKRHEWLAERGLVTRGRDTETGMPVAYATDLGRAVAELLAAEAEGGVK